MSEIREMQLEIVSMMKEVDALFTEHNIKYTLLGGSVLGSIRHNGFIPWDDDMDIGVLRKDFDQAEQLLSKNKKYVYETAEKHIIPDAPIGHLHLVNEKYAIENSPTIDLFALDRVPSEKRARKRLRLIANLHHLSVLRLPPRNRGKIQRIIIKIILFMTPKKVWSFIQRKTLEYIVKLNNKNFTDIGNIFGAWTEREYFNSSIYLETVKSSFEDLKLPIPKQYDFYLSHGSRYCLVGQEENKGVLNYYDSVKECIKARKTERRNKIIKGFKKSILNWGSEKK